LGYLRFALKLWPVIAYGIAVDVLTAVIADRLGAAITGPPVTLILLVVIVLNPLILPSREIFEPTHSPLDVALTRELHVLAELACVEPVPCHRLTGRFGKQHVTAIIKDKRIFVTQLAIERLGIEGVRFMLAHEVAHLIRLKELSELRPQGGRGVGLWLFAMATFMAFGIVVLRVNPLGPKTVVGLGLMLLAVTPALVYASKYSVTSPEIELWCDKKGAEITGDPQAALETLQVILEKQTARDARWAGYPTAESRLGQMRAILDEFEASKGSARSLNRK